MKDNGTPSFEMSPDTRFLRQRLRKLSPDEQVSYDDLSAEVGKPVSGAFAPLQSAMHGLLAEGYVFATIRGKAIKRLNDTQIVAAADQDVATMRRRAKRGAKKLAVADYSRLSDKDKLAHSAKISIMALIATFTSDKTITKIEGAVGGRSGELPIKETIKALGYTV